MPAVDDLYGEVSQFLPVYEGGIFVRDVPAKFASEARNGRGNRACSFDCLLGFRCNGSRFLSRSERYRESGEHQWEQMSFAPQCLSNREARPRLTPPECLNCVRLTDGGSPAAAFPRLVRWR